MTLRRSFVFPPALATAMLPLVTAALLLAGCGDKFGRENFAPDGYTTIRFQGKSAQNFNLSELFSTGEFPGEAEPLAIPTNGMIIFALNIGNQSLHRLYVSPPQVSVMATEITVSWTLPNGSYHFYTVGYSSADMGGDPLCSIGTDANSYSLVLLSGSPTAVYLTPLISNCVDPSQPFYYGPFETGTRDVLFCSGGVPSVSSPTNICSTFSSTTYTNFGSVMFTIDDDNFDPYSSNPPPGLKSGCLAVSAGIVTMPKLPAGNPSLLSNMRIQSELLAWNSANTSCTGKPDRVFIFPRGMAAAKAAQNDGSLVDPFAPTNYAYSEKAKWTSMISPSSASRLFIVP